MLKLTHIEIVTPDQIKFGMKLGIDLTGCSLSLSLAKIHDTIDKHFNGIDNLGCPTERQTSFAKDMGYDISNATKREAHAVIDDIMHQLNMNAIEQEKLEPGVKVINEYNSKQVEIISSIKENGTCYLRGGHGKKAWARNLRRANNSE